MLFVYSGFLVVIATIGLALSQTEARSQGFNLRDLSLATMIGMLAIYSAAMLVSKLDLLLLIVSFLSLSAAMRLLLLTKKNRGRLFAARFDWQGLTVAGCFLAILAYKIFAQSLTDWDARSIWFFQGKIIYYMGEVLNSAVWGDPSLSWAHFDYPKLNAICAGLVAKVIGHWNEVDPRVSLLLLETPLFLLSAGFGRSLTRKVLLTAIIAFKVGTLMWDGRMDGILAAYIALGAIYAGRYLRDRDSGDLLLAIVASGVAATIKNEGIALALLVYISLAAGLLLYARRELWRMLPSTLASASLILMAIGSWAIWKHLHGINNDLSSGSPLNRLLARLNDGHSVEVIVAAINRPKEVRALAPFVLAALVSARLSPRSQGRPLFIALIPSVFVAGSYAALLLVIYLSTPVDLSWHLDTSASRTVQPIYLSILLGIAAYLGEPEVIKET